MATISVKKQEVVAVEDNLYFDQQALTQQEQLKQLHEAVGLAKEKEKQAQLSDAVHRSSEKTEVKGLSVAITFTLEQFAAYIDAIIDQAAAVLNDAAETKEEKAAVPIVVQSMNRAVKKPAPAQPKVVAEEHHTVDEKEMMQTLETLHGGPMTANARGAIVGRARQMYTETKQEVNTFTKDPSIIRGANSLLEKPRAKEKLTPIFGLVSYLQGAQQGNIKNTNPNTTFGVTAAAPTPAPRPGMAPPRPAPRGTKNPEKKINIEQTHNSFGLTKIDYLVGNFLHHYKLSPEAQAMLERVKQNAAIEAISALGPGYRKG